MKLGSMVVLTALILNSSVLLASSITAIELAEKMVNGRKNYTVIDLSSSTEKLYLKNVTKIANNQDPMAEVSKVVSSDQQHQLILIGDTEAAVKTLADSLLSKKYQVFILNGGVESWKKEILDPKLAPENKDYKKIMSLSNFLKGKTEPNPTAAVATKAASKPKAKVEVKKKESSGGGGC